MGRDATIREPKGALGLLPNADRTGGRNGAQIAEIGCADLDLASASSMRTTT